MALPRWAPGLLLTVVAAGIAPSAAGGAERARPARATPVDADLGAVAWSAWDAAAGAYRMVVRDPAGAVRTLPVTPSPEPFDLDVGDDAQGRRVVVYTGGQGVAGGPIRIVRLAGGADAPVDIPGRTDERARTPTVSRGRLAWATGGDGEYQEASRLWVHRLGSRDRPRRVPGPPAERCGEVPGGLGRLCAPVTGNVEELELRGSVLALTATSSWYLPATAYSEPGPTERTAELRVVDLGTRRSRVVARSGTGDGVERYIGPSIDAGRVHAFKTCFGDPSPCARGAGHVRSGLRSGPVELAASARQLSGFSVDRGRVLAVRGGEPSGCELGRGGYEGVPLARVGPCPVEQRPLPARWLRIRR